MGRSERAMEEISDFLSGVLVEDSGPHDSTVLMQGGFVSVSQSDEMSAYLQGSLHYVTSVYGVEPGFGFNVVHKHFFALIQRQLHRPPWAP